MANRELLLETAGSLDHLGQGISLKMIQFLNTVKTHPIGFRDLGLDFLEICKIINALKSTLQGGAQTIHEKALSELLKVLSQTYDDFSQLQRLLEKFTEFEKGGTFAMLQKSWRLVFADKDVAKVHKSLQENRGSSRYGHADDQHVSCLWRS
jgi:hypothetical protein